MLRSGGPRLGRSASARASAYVYIMPGVFGPSGDRAPPQRKGNRQVTATNGGERQRLLLTRGTVGAAG